MAFWVTWVSAVIVGVLALRRWPIAVHVGCGLWALVRLAGGLYAGDSWRTLAWWAVLAAVNLGAARLEVARRAEARAEAEMAGSGDGWHRPGSDGYRPMRWQRDR